MGSDRKIHRKFVIGDGVNVEVYRNCERFITVTGDRILPSLDQLVDIDAIADQVVAELDAAKKAKQPAVLRSFEPHGRDLADIIRNGCGTSFGGDKSRAVWFVIHALLEQGRTIEEITAVLIDPNNGISAHLLSRPEDPAAYAHRQIRKAKSERAKSAKPPDGGPDSAGAEIVRLATVSSLHYERERRAAAKRLGVRSGILDGLVKAERKKSAGDGSGLQGHAIELPEPKPSESPVDGAAYLTRSFRKSNATLYCRYTLPAPAHVGWCTRSWPNSFSFHPG